MDWIHTAWPVTNAIWADVKDATPQAKFSLWALGFISAIVLFLATTGVSQFVSARRVKNAKPIRIKVSDEDDKVRLHPSTIDKLGLSTKRGTRVFVTSCKPRGRGYRRIETIVTNLDWRANNLNKDTLEVSDRTLAKLFKGQNVQEGDPVFLQFKLYQLRGLADFWFTPDERARFANRFVVYLSALVLAIEFISGALMRLR